MTVHLIGRCNLMHCHRNHYRQMVEGIDAWFKGEAPRKLV